ncbi:carbohydrate ABC transporter permease [Cellulomonas sp. ATA003]|uniref:carbohydrate ABC transporter permease n=1 Tax=Cellulomonas sp. ATA003 TaxID=3073064 RepID=UPI002873A756|nr:carbohydrate ABC transporter permease [Cellulomonas sp. ATA003]WNB84550.1 carbohydrate ABC transporter permease [Cellulomonas sp. ATA003]
MSTLIRPADTGRGTATSETDRTRRPAKRRSVLSHTFLVLLVLYFAMPLWWLVVASTKDINGLFTGTGGPLWFDENFSLVDNVRQLFTQGGGIYWRWLGNSFLYAFAGGIGATVLSVLAGYGFAKYRFPGRNLYFAVLLGSVMVPVTALVIPTFVLLAELRLTNTIWAVILPSLLSPFGVYLMRVYAADAVPDELLDAARVDGAGDLRTFVSVALPLLRPAIVTVLLLSTVATWNNYFLPLAVLSDTKLLPITVGLGQWQAQSTSGAAGSQLWNLVVTGALISIIPLVVSFLALQKYWQGGLTMGSLK